MILKVSPRSAKIEALKFEDFNKKTVLLEDKSIAGFM